LQERLSSCLLALTSREPALRDSSDITSAPVFELLLVSMGGYCQELATQVLDDFAAVGTFLLNCEETFRDGLGCVSLARRNSL